ncbi:uncharacterized protein LOC110979528 [Acanthaster planci]|uniref:Uncharacterized protein LOC110979528 n=1 Tax=Acanthaster planci TaxID=133434 RepID=A0A8B7YHH4_ACAPL|nr:uncharacterized protein LOC110979528 [Acanthaster planci]XP_022091086.1 uncharacterized protein LOC110979528 [Acanthaster planci]
MSSMKTVRFEEPERPNPIPQQALPPLQQNQVIPHASSQQQPTTGMMLLYPENLQQQHQQQQFIAVPQPVVSGAPVPGQQLYVQPHPYRDGAVLLGQVAPAPKNRRYRAKAARTLAILQIVLATLSVILGIITIVAGSTGSWLGLPIWSACFFYLPAGILGVLTAKPMNMQICLMNSCMVMSILSSLLATSCMIFSIAVATAEHTYYEYIYVVYSNRVVYWSLLAFVSLGEIIVSITQSAYCCHARCNCCRNSPSGPVRVQYAPQVHYLVPPNQNTQPQMANPVQQQQQRQVMMQQEQIPRYGYDVQSAARVQSVAPDGQNATDNVSDDE